MNRNQALLRHFLAAIAYRTAKALRDAPSGFESFEAGHKTRTPRQLARAAPRSPDQDWPEAPDNWIAPTS